MEQAKEDTPAKTDSQLHIVDDKSSNETDAVVIDQESSIKPQIKLEVESRPLEPLKPIQ